MTKKLTLALIVTTMLSGCSIGASRTQLNGPVYAQRAYLGQIGMPIQSDIAIIQAPQEHVIWVSLSDSKATPFQWLAPPVSLSAMAKQAMGVPQVRDRAPITALAKPPVQTSTVTFQFGSARLDETAKAKINSLQVDDMSAIDVIGNTDNVGSDAYNKNLSEQRANSVKNHLVVRGVKPNKISTAGKGKLDPVGDNKTAAGRAANRRADMTVEDVK